MEARLLLSLGNIAAVGGAALTPVNVYLSLGDSNTGPGYSAFSEAPTSYIANDSASASNIYDARLSGTITPLIAPRSATVTMTIAAPCVVTDTAHGLVAGAPWTGSTTGAFPTGITAGNELYVASSPAPTTDTYSLTTTYGGAALTTTGSQSGVHTATANCGLQHQVDLYSQNITANLGRNSCGGHFEWVKQLRIDQASQRVDFIDVSKGGSRFSDAGPGGSPRALNWDASLTDGAYNDLKVRVAAYTALLAVAGKSPNWVGCGISGPANGIVDTTESNAFQTKLTALVAAIRADIIGNSVPIVIYRVGTTTNQAAFASFATNMATVRAAQAAVVAAEVAAGRTAYLINADGLVASDSPTLHWSLGSHIALNRAAYCDINDIWHPGKFTETNALTHRLQLGDIRGAPLSTFSGTSLITALDTIGGFSPTQGTPGNRPTLVTAALSNGYPTCRGASFDGTNDVLLSASGAMITPNTDWDFYAVVSGAATANKFFFGVGGATATPFMGFGTKSDGSGKLIVSMRDDASGSTTPVDSGLVAFDGSKHFIRISKSGSTWTFQVDGTVGTPQTLAPGTTTVNRTSIGALNSSAGTASAWMVCTIWDIRTAGVGDATYVSNARAHDQRMWGTP